MSDTIYHSRRCWAEIDPNALQHNLRSLRSHLGPHTGLMAVVKADAYGHGLELTAHTISQEVDWLCVANLGEALRLRTTLQSDSPPILILSPILPDEIPEAVRHSLSCSVSTVAEVKEFGRIARELSLPAKLHAVADTGMGRMGALPSDWSALLHQIDIEDGCLLEGAATHFPNADEDAEFTLQQIASFREMTQGLDCLIHVANSAGIIDFAKQTDYATLARPGLAIYGVSPSCRHTIDLAPALTLKSKVTLVKEVPAGTTVSYGSTYRADRPMRIATIALGYGDGYPRHVSGQGASVLIRGMRCTLLGRVTMDQIVVDVTHLSEAAAGDEVVLYGRQGDTQISTAEVASWAHTIPWEILTSITKRVERILKPSE